VDADDVITVNPATANAIADAMLMKLRLGNDRSRSAKIIVTPPLKRFLVAIV